MASIKYTSYSNSEGEAAAAAGIRRTLRLCLITSSLVEQHLSRDQKSEYADRTGKKKASQADQDSIKCRLVDSLAEDPCLGGCESRRGEIRSVCHQTREAGVQRCDQQYPEQHSPSRITQNDLAPRGHGLFRQRLSVRVSDSDRDWGLSKARCRFLPPFSQPPPPQMTLPCSRPLEPDDSRGTPSKFQAF